MNRRIIFFHSNCMDGFGALWAFQPNKEDLLIPSIAGQPFAIPNFEEGFYSIICLDISPPVEQLEKLLEYKNILDITIIDHHKVNLSKYTNDKIRLVWDDKKSGAVLSWEDRKYNSDIPTALLYIQDRDLWSWKLKDSKSINQAMYNRLRIPTPKTTSKQIRDELEKFDLLVKFVDESNGLQTLAHEGNESLKKTDTIVNFLTEQAEKAVLDIENVRYKVFLFTTRQYRSEVGSALMKRQWSSTELPDFSVGYTINFPTKEVWLSLRSVEGKTDVSDVFKKLDPKSGGHRNAAGATISLNEFVSLIVPRMD